MKESKKAKDRTSLVVQQQRLQKTAGSQCRGQGLIPGWGTRSHMLQLRPGAPKYVNKYLNKKLNNYNNKKGKRQK